MSALFPSWATRVTDLPYRLFDAIRYALVFLSWEELPDDERPPRRIWHDGDALEEHFRWVKKMREDKYKTDGGGSGEIEDPVRNQAASSLIVGD